MPLQTNNHETIRETPSVTQIDRWANSAPSYDTTDYTRFEDAKAPRALARNQFINGTDYAPSYNYPRLDGLYDQTGPQDLADAKKAIYEAVLELEANKSSGLYSPEEFELSASYQEMRLKKILLVEAARRMRYATSSSEQFTARQEFMTLNKEIYGELDHAEFEGIMTTEKQRLESFTPQDDRAAAIKQDLNRYYSGCDYDTPEQPIIEPEVMTALKQIIQERYGHILAKIPDTPNDTHYNANQIASIINETLSAGGLAADGWVAEVSDTRSVPATNTNDKKIYIPANSRRNASEIRRLVLHEQEVHARRGQNGIETGIEAIAKGTSRYGDVEEGLAVLLECIEAGSLDSPAFNRARNRYITAGLALGADGTPRDGRQTYELLWRILAIKGSADGTISEDLIARSKAEAYLHVDNAFRGTDFAMPGVIYTKLKMYKEGFRKNGTFFNKRKDNLNAALDDTMIGKIDHTDEEEVATVREAIKSHARRRG